MSEQDMQEEETAPPADTDSAPDAAAPEPQAEQPADGSVRRWTLITVVLIVALLAWYLAADRFTPFTSQARVDAYVIPIAPQVTGNVLSVGVVNNQRVAPHAELVRLDDAQYLLSVERARADLETAQQSLGASAAGVESATATLAAARSEQVRAEKDFDRQRRIKAEDPGAISQRRLDIAEATYNAAISRVAAATAEVERARQTMGREGEDNAGIQAARSALEKAQLDLERTRLYAPEGGGLVVDLQVDVGNLAQAGQSLMTFVGINDVWIQADLRENNLAHIEPGASVDIALDVHPGRIFHGRVRSIGFGVDSGTGSALGGLPTIENDRNWLRDAQRFPVIIEIDGAGDEPLGLRVGAQATVMIYTGKGFGFILTPLGKLYMRVASLFSYAY